MASAPQNQAHQQPSSSPDPGEAIREQVVPAKREHDDEVHFISSQPINKIRRVGEDNDNGGRPAMTIVSNHEDGRHPQTIHDSSRHGRSVNALPLGLPTPLSTDPILDTQGSSLPAMENFSFTTAIATTSARSSTPAAVSPKQLPQTLPAGVCGGVSTQSGPVSPSPATTIGHMSCLDVANSLSTSNMDAMAKGRDMNGATDLNGMNGSKMPAEGNLSIPSFAPAGPFSAESPISFSHYPQSGYMPTNNSAPMPFAIYSMGSLVPIPQVPPTLNSSLTGLAGSGAIPNNHAFNQQNQGGSEGPSLPIPPNWGAVPGTYAAGLPRPHHSLTSQMSMASLNPEYRGNIAQPMVPQKRPCLACAAARKQGCHPLSHGQHQEVRPHGTSSSHPSHPPSRSGASGLQSYPCPPGTVRPATDMDIAQTRQGNTGANTASSPLQTYPPVLKPAFCNDTSGLQLSQPCQGPFTMTETNSASAPALMSYQSGLLRSHNSAHFVNSSTPMTNSNPVPTALQNANSSSINHSASLALPSSTERPMLPVVTTSASYTNTLKAVQPPTQTLAMQTPQKPNAQYRQQAKPVRQPQPSAACPQQRQPSAAIPAAAEAAAALASKRKHAANLLVDVAELVAEIFPFEIVARKHGTLPRKVAEALAAVVQVPLLRCASDKRRTGKLGSDRMKEFREARKGWVAMVKEWEKEDPNERDAEGEPDDGEQRLARDQTQPRQAGERAAVTAATVYVPGEPSALDVALLLAPTEMPAQILKETFFTGPW